ncbi:universal stress protein [Mycolicibacterium smegmatis]|uniref:Universal stress protein family protein, putative n=1 Tax=Mycolicibacterium smegmatis (strain MKD8) TaxID=1214915 RepID=A0A2U9PR19_MYCSE|nr:universal stress protein [Mycolicibacterium smegmatis]AWT54249.1 universal stress protein family protein, putative [Mycolicibacterium smegmatis MKD8]MDF1903767.1 universal stress protein [Mycolicibacterium smegmatis]MDF1910257.1 universal stress protein [Mycolicibacterium smegmatis]MDF1916118.1 universal stress protein [Mycolicibacterium smegmatis]MDF1928580.1 universal stress protein [Mycolicibacterium smegmatis]
MGGYRTVIVGTDGSTSSMRAVERAGAVAAQENAKLIIATAHFHHGEKGGWARPPAPDQVRDRRAEDALGREGYRMHGDADAYEVLRDARDVAYGAGARDIHERVVEGAPVAALLTLAKEVDADLIVVGDVGLDSVAGRLLGSVPAEIARKSKVDILIVHTAN